MKAILKQRRFLTNPDSSRVLHPVHELPEELSLERLVAHQGDQEVLQLAEAVGVADLDGLDHGLEEQEPLLVQERRLEPGLVRGLVRRPRGAGDPLGASSRRGR